MDERIQRLPVHERSQKALEAVWDVFSLSTGETLDTPPTESQRRAVASWVQSLASNRPHFLVRDGGLRAVIERTVPELASMISQHPCSFHHPDDLGGPIRNFPVRIDPWSAQATPEKVAIRTAVTAALKAQNGTHEVYQGPICVSITAVVSSAHRASDVDNLAKGLLDALQGYLYRNDSQIECLTLRRMPHPGTQGNYLVRIAPVRPWDEYVIHPSDHDPIVLWGQVGYPGR